MDYSDDQETADPHRFPDFRIQLSSDSLRIIDSVQFSSKFGFCHCPVDNDAILSVVPLFPCLCSLAMASLRPKKLVQAHHGINIITQYRRIGRETRPKVTTTERADWVDWFEKWAKRQSTHAGENPA